MALQTVINGQSMKRGKDALFEALGRSKIGEVFTYADLGRITGESDRVRQRQIALVVSRRAMGELGLALMNVPGVGYKNATASERLRAGSNLSGVRRTLRQKAALITVPDEHCTDIQQRTRDFLAINVHQLAEAFNKESRRLSLAIAKPEVLPAPGGNGN